MAGTTPSQSKKIRQFILDHTEKSPNDVTKTTVQHFEITRQAVNKHLRKLVRDGILERTGNTSGTRYRLVPQLQWSETYKVDTGLEEHVVWERDIRERLSELPTNALGSWQYGFTEMFNNAIEHSGGSRIIVQFEGTFARTEMMISDDGYGIFRKIKEEVGLPDERHAVLELAKGKLTTDPDHHTGEGIFFTSRIFDSFEILSGKDYFSHRFEDPKDWIMESSSSHGGTYVRMRLDNHSSRTAKEIFDQFTSGDDYGFTKTIIPLRMMASSGGDRLISRSQARRVLARIELFRTVLFDFSDVESIGQAFADEIFRVFARQHPEIELIPINASSETRKMISRASGG